MTRILTRILGNIAGVYVAAWFVPGFVINGNNKAYLTAGVILGILNLTIKPILKAFTFPLIIITLGLFTIVINSVILWVAAYIFPSILIADTFSLVMATIVISIVNILVSLIIKII